MVNVTDGADVYVRLGALEGLFGHKIECKIFKFLPNINDKNFLLRIKIRASKNLEKKFHAKKFSFEIFWIFTFCIPGEIKQTKASRRKTDST